MIFIFFLVGALISVIAPIISFDYGIIFDIILLILALVVYSHFVEQALNKKDDIEEAIREYKFKLFSFSIGVIAGIVLSVMYHIIG